MSQQLKNPPAMQETQETQLQSLGQEVPLEDENATRSSILPWKNPMDRGAWWTTVLGIAKCRHDWEAKNKHKEK